LLVILVSLSLLSPTPVLPASPEGISLRVMTYNIHSCRGRDRKIRPDRIAQVIAAHHPDVVALQEVRVGRVTGKSVSHPGSEKEGMIPPPVGEAPLPPPSVIPPRAPSNTAPEPIPFTDNPRAIADALGMSYVFYPLVRTDLEDYGIAVLSRFPIKLIRAENLPTLERRKPLERRGAIWVELDVNGVSVQVINTHLGLNTIERKAQAEALLGEDWMGNEKFREPFILCGDFNSRPKQPAYKKLAERAVDAAHLASAGKAKATWPSSAAFFRIDHIFMPRSAQARATKVPDDDVARLASDHLPVWVDVTFPSSKS
jgi:endonuclease/exonuclease/phosphatase family metal-dependent hydrolase